MFCLSRVKFGSFHAPIYNHEHYLAVTFLLIQTLIRLSCTSLLTLFNWESVVLATCVVNLETALHLIPCLPVEFVSIPSSELYARVMAARLCLLIQDELRFHVDTITYW